GVTADDGSYHVTQVPVGSYDIGAQASGFRGGSAPGQAVKWGEETVVPEIDLVIEPGNASLRGVAQLYGRSDHGGTQVTLVGTGLSATTASDGSWHIDQVPEGTFALHFVNGAYQETVPEVEALVGADGWVIDQSLYPLAQSPLTIYPGRRVAES